MNSDILYITLYTLLGSALGTFIILLVARYVPGLIDRLTPNIDEQKEIVRGNQAAAQFFGLVSAAVIIGGSIVVAAAVLGGRLWVTGGYDGGELTTVEVYDPATNTWDRSKAPMTTQRHYHALAVLFGELHAIGGAGSPVACVILLIRK